MDIFKSQRSGENIQLGGITVELTIPFDCDAVENAFKPLDLDDSLPCDFVNQVKWFETKYECSLIRTDGDMYFQFWSESDLILFLLKWSK
jgi:hypothetical protein